MDADLYYSVAWFIPLIAAGVAAGGGIASSLINSSAQADANKTNRDIAKDQMNFQEEMSSTAYQRGVADMKKAGINPMLAGINQSPASSPQGASTRVESTRPGDAVSAGVNSAMEAASMVQGMAKTDAEIKLNQAQEVAQSAQAMSQIASAKQMEVETKNAELEGIKRKAELPAKKKEAEVAAKTAEFDKHAVVFDSVLKRVEATVGAAGSAISSIFRPTKRSGPTGGGGGGQGPLPGGKRFHRLATGQVLDTKTGSSYGPKPTKSSGW